MRKIVLVFLFYVMILTAVFDSLRGLFMPLFRDKFNLNDVQLSLIISVSYTGFLVFTFIGSWLISNLKNKVFLFIALNIGAIVFFILSFVNSYYLLLFFIFVQCGVSCMLGLYINGNVPIMYPVNIESTLSFMHFSYGAAMSLTQFIVGKVIGRGIGYESIYLTLSIGLLISSFILFPLRFENIEVVEEKANEKVKVSKALILFIFAVGSYFIAEHVTMNWFITFSLNAYEVQYDYAANLSAAFFTLFTIGRFLGGFLMKKFTKERVILTFLICAFVLYTIGILTNQSGLMLISVSGFFFSVVMTIIFLLINDCFPNSYVKTLSVILIFADLIEILANLFLGFLFEEIGYRLTFFIVPVALITCFVCLYTVVKNKNVKKKNDLLKGC